MAAAVKMHEDRLKLLTFKQESIDVQRRMIRGWASTPQVDRDNEVVEPSSFQASIGSFMANPIVLLNHDMDRAIGKVISLEIRTEGLWVEVQITDKTPDGLMAWGLIEDGILKTFSVRFLGIDGEWDQMRKLWRWTETELWELSVVTIPANPGAVFEMAKGRGIEMRPVESFSGTDEEREESRCLESCKRAGQSTESIANIVRHWEKTSGAPSETVISACVEATSSMVASTSAVLKAGRVLSAANRSSVDAAVEALQEVQARDDASRDQGDGDGKSARPRLVTITL